MKVDFKGQISLEKVTHLTQEIDLKNSVFASRVKCAFDQSAWPKFGEYISNDYWVISDFQ